MAKNSYVWNGTSWELIGAATVTTAYSAGTGLDLSNNVFSVTPNTYQPFAGYTTTATAAGTTTLTSSSTPYQVFTGSTTQTVKLPVTSTLVVGQSFYIDNDSTGNVTVQASDASQIIVIPGMMAARVTCISTSVTTSAGWDASLNEFHSLQGTGTSLVTNVSPTITTPVIDSISASSATAVNPSLFANTTTGTINIGAGLTTGTLNLDSVSTDTHTVNIGTGAPAASKVKTINIGTGAPGSGASTMINIGNASSSSVTVNVGEYAKLVANIINVTNLSSTVSLYSSLSNGSLNLANSTTFSGTLSIANASTSAHTIAISNGVGTTNKTINIGTSSTGGTTAITLGSLAGATSTIALNGTATIRSSSAYDGIIIQGRAGGTGTYGITITPTTLASSTTITLPNITGTALVTSGTTATAGYFDTGTTTPSGTTRLNYGGYLYSTRLYSNSLYSDSHYSATGAAAASTIFSDVTTGSVSIASGLTTGSIDIAAAITTGTVSISNLSSGVQTISIGNNSNNTGVATTMTQPAGGQTTATVASATGIFVGMEASGASITTAGTTVTNINGTTITFSNTIASGSAVSVSFGWPKTINIGTGGSGKMFDHINIGANGTTTIISPTVNTSSSFYNAGLTGRTVVVSGSPYTIGSNTTSSIRYKTDIESFTWDKDSILSLDTKRFKYIKHGENAEWFYGLLAEDMADAGFEWLIDRDEEGRPDYIYWSERMPQVLFSIVKQLNEENKQLKARLDAAGL